jgi:hypothetical protein
VKRTIEIVSSRAVGNFMIGVVTVAVAASPLTGRAETDAATKLPRKTKSANAADRAYSAFM